MKSYFSTFNYKQNSVKNILIQINFLKSDLRGENYFIKWEIIMICGDSLRNNELRL